MDGESGVNGNFVPDVFHDFRLTLFPLQPFVLFHIDFPDLD